MAEFHRAENGIGWLKITWIELVQYSENVRPICDECLDELIGIGNVVLIPLLNEAFCPECGKKVLARMHNYDEDKPYAARKEQFWLNYFGIKEAK